MSAAEWIALVAAFAALASAAFAGTIWKVNKRQLEHTRKVDRAYVSGGGPGNPPHGPFVLTIDNYGRTPATLIEYAVDFCEVTAIPREPTYLAADFDRVRLRAIYPPDTTSEVAVIPYGNLKQPVVFGRFWYEDVWKEPHYFSFILRLPPTDPLPANISPAYTAWT